MKKIQFVRYSKPRNTIELKIMAQCNGLVLEEIKNPLFGELPPPGLMEAYNTIKSILENIYGPNDTYKYSNTTRLRMYADHVAVIVIGLSTGLERPLCGFELIKQ